MSRLIRQSFLGSNSDTLLKAATVGIVGLGGGGSHIVQQLNHAGIGGYVLSDHDVIDEGNTNRLIGGTLQDVKDGASKIAIANRSIRGLQPEARIINIQSKWQSALDLLKTCDVIVGAVDSFTEREQLERFARQHLIPYIDIGMSVIKHQHGYLISGQVILSTPGSPCLRCCGLINDSNIKLEAEKYGDAGEQPQVVWPNGVLASTAVGLVIQLLTPWYNTPPLFQYLEYNGNDSTMSTSKKYEYLKRQSCNHHPMDETGDQLFDIRTHLNRIQKSEVVQNDWVSNIIEKILTFFKDLIKID